MSITYSFSPVPESLQKKLAALESVYEVHAQKIRLIDFTRLAADLSPLPAYQLPKNIDHVYVVGMGGASLGAKVIAHANVTEPTRKSLEFLDNIDPSTIQSHLSRLRFEKKKSFYVLASKSGETIEVLALAKILLKAHGNSKAFLVMTDNPKSTLGQLAERQRIPIILTPKTIPGRFSVLSHVGLFPVSLLSAETIPELLGGASQTPWRVAYQLACLQYLHFKERKNITALFCYSDHLERLLDWYIQLLAESIGKSSKVGITPIKAMGPRDQHSQLQLFLDGPPDKFFIFLKQDTCGKKLEIPEEKYTLSDLFNAEYEGVKHAFLQTKLPFAEIRFSELTAAVLGELFFFFELQTAFLGSLFKINFQNQPAVELSKKITRKLLEDTLKKVE